jgi:CubicO group peptidase (beta-lactamase class C family)
MKCLAMRNTLTVAALFLLTLATTASSQDAARMERVVQDAVQKRTFSGAVLVARGSEILLSKGYGLANVEWDVPNAPTTKFRLGSITKQFTAASILLLEERGRLKTDERLKTYLPDIPPAWDRITVRNLLTHTSGIPNFTALASYHDLQVSPTSPDKIIAMLKERPLDFEPGEKMLYSNSGYVVLGAIIERVTGGSYAEFVTKNLFAPLGMTDSGYDSNTAIIPRRAAGYTSGPAGPLNAGYIHMSVPHAAGALYSTTLDLLKWEQALFGGKVLQPASLQKMTTPFKNDYAFGLLVHTTKEGRKVVEHNGGIDGFNTHLAYYPDSKITVIVLANLNGQAPAQIGSSLESLAHGDALPQVTERREGTPPDAAIPAPRAHAAITLSIEKLSRLVGTYDMQGGVTMSIALEGDHLTTQLSGQPAFRIFAESESTFFLRVVDATLEFDRNASGAVAGVTLRQGSVTNRGTRR